MRIRGFLLTLLMFAALDAHAKGPEISGGFPVTKRTEIYPLAKIKRGDKGIGYTVFAADKAEPFEFEVLGLLENMLGPKKHVILARLSGEQIEFTGVISGMSGSPVYIDGLLVGAVSYRFGMFSKEPIAGITPIESMIEVYQLEPGERRAGTIGKARGIKVSDFRKKEAEPLSLPKIAQVFGPYGAQAIETPIMMSGLAPQVANELRAQLEGAGFVAMSSGSAMSARTVAARKDGKRTVDKNEAGTAGRVKASRIAPASAIAAILMRGDIVVAATGTVTFVDGDQVLAFGHPFFGYGTVAFPMATASILNTLASPVGSYKMGAPALEVGSITHDRLTAIAGKIGEVVPMVPAHIHLDGEGKTPDINVAVEIVDDENWLPVMLSSAMANATSGRLDYEAGGTVDFSTTIEVGDRAISFHDTYSAPAPMPVALFAARDVANTVAMITMNNLERAKIKNIDVKMKVRSEVSMATIEQIVPDRTLVEAGEKVGLTVRVRPYLKDPVYVRLSVEIPKDVRGDVEIFVGGGIEMDRREGDIFGERYPENLDALLGILVERRPARAMYAAVFAPRPGLRANAEVLTSLPPSMRATLAGEPGRSYRSLTETLGKVAELQYPDVVYGSVSVPITVVRDGSGS
jgi:hypothetical protein